MEIAAGIVPAGGAGAFGIDRAPVVGMARPNGGAARPMAMSAASAAAQPRVPESQFGKVQRNAPCPCGSGKKFKQCHGKV